MRKARLVVLISGGGTNLQAFIDATADGSLPAQIAAVISNRDGVFGLERARLAGIPTRVVDHRQFAERADFDAQLAATIDGFEPDLVILAGFMRILTEAFVAHFHGRLLNIHPSLLPKYPGLETHRRAIEAGDTEAGATVHFVTGQLDGGPAIVQARVPVLAGDDPQALAARVLEREHHIYPLAARWFLQGRVRLDNNHCLLDGEPLPPGGLISEE